MSVLASTWPALPTWAIRAAWHGAALAGCAPVPRLSYAPWDVGWAGVLLAAVTLAAGVACVGLLGNMLRWTADDPAPLRPLWMTLIVLGFCASAVGIYVGLANQAHIRALQNWLVSASATCIEAMNKSPNFYTSSVDLSLHLGTVAIALILVGVVGASIERRRARPRAK